MYYIIFLGYRMGSYYYWYSIFFFDKFFKLNNIWAWRIANNKTCCKVNCFCSVINYFFGSIFNISTRTASTCSISNYIDSIIFFINIKSTFTILYCSETFTTSTITVKITYNNSDFYFVSSFF